MIQDVTKLNNYKILYNCTKSRQLKKDLPYIPCIHGCLPVGNMLQRVQKLSWRSWISLFKSKWRDHFSTYSTELTWSNTTILAINLIKHDTIYKPQGRHSSHGRVRSGSSKICWDLHLPPKDCLQHI